jgi:hypothetical protein
MVDHGDFRLSIALESVENLVVFFAYDVLGLEASEQIQPPVVAFKPAEHSKSYANKLLPQLQTLIIIEIGPREHHLPILLKQMIIGQRLIRQYAKPPDERLERQNQFLEL